MYLDFQMVRHITALSALVGLVKCQLTNTNLQTSLPASSGTTNLPAAQTVAAGQSLDGGMLLWDRSPSTCNGQTEGGQDDALLVVQEGATVSNLIVGPGSGEGIYCLGACNLTNVWWADVCEDAATFKQTTGTSYITGGGAFSADDKVLQHNGGGTVAVQNFYAQDVGKLYRSCGNCKQQFIRTSSFDNVKVVNGSVAVAINGNLGDTTKITNSCVSAGEKKVCALYEGNDSGAEPSKTASVADGTTCATTAVQVSGC